MINPNYYDEKTGQLLPCYKWYIASNKELHPEEHHKAMMYAGGFVNHPTIEPYDAYSEKIIELIEQKTRPEEFELEDLSEVFQEVA